MQISAIRRVLAQAPGGERWVETLARRGYRFVGPVLELAETPLQRSGDRSNLPEALTSFVGREGELAEIKQLLPGTRLLTLVGVGGIGKTRLALQVAAEVVDAYRDGVWFVDLAPLTDAKLVPSAVAQVLHIRDPAGKWFVDTLCNQIRARQLLLLLDNCEHLLDACISFADAVLGSTTQTTIIATSREPLQVAGEQIYAVQTLSLPDPAASAESIGRSEAVRLFVDRAQRQLRGFSLTPDRASVIAELCTHLDGIPLALELAAARIRSLSVGQINARIGDRFRLLTGGSRSALPRQQTLRATFDWSFDLLTEEERIVMRRLSVFPSSFTLEAASFVSSDEAIDENAVIDLLSQLVGRSLIIADTSNAGARYRLLETTRAYGLEKLADAGETNAVKSRHAQYFRDQVDRAYDDWLRMPDVQWLAVYSLERDNIRAALDWALGVDGDPAIGVAVAGASGALWAQLSLQSEGRQRLEAAVASLGAQTPVAEQARLWLWLGLLRRYGAPVEAVAALEQAIDLYREMGDELGLGHALARLGAALTQLSRFDESAVALEEALPLLERAGQPKALGFYYSELGRLKKLTGELTAARTYLDKAFTLLRDSGSESAALGVLGNFADMTWTLGDVDAALAAFREAVALMRKSPQTRKFLLGVSLTNLAGVHTERGELDQALAAAREGLPLLQEASYAWGTLDHLALRTALAGKVTNAARLAGYADSAHAARQATRQANEARARNRLQLLLREKLSADELERLLADGAKISEEEACRVALEG